MVFRIDLSRRIDWFRITDFSTLFLASFIQTRIAANYGMRSGHILPIPDPSVLLALLRIVDIVFHLAVWYLLHSNLAKNGCKTMAKFQSLAWTSISVPIVMLLSGFIFWALGFAFTASSYDLTGEPYRANAPFLIEFLATISPLSIEHLDWSHPFFFVLDSLRLLVGCYAPNPYISWWQITRRTHGHSRSTKFWNTNPHVHDFDQCAYFIFNTFNGFTIWIPVLSVLIPLLLFMGSDARSCHARW